MARSLRLTFFFAIWLTNFGAKAQFGNEQVIHTGDGPGRMQVADMDGDGDNDLFGIFGQHDLKWFENTDGNGTFGAANVISEIDGECRQSNLADPDGDLDMDIFFIADTDAAIGILLNDGAGNFIAGTPVALPSTPETFTVVDVSGDGRLDLVATVNTMNGPGLAILRGTEDGFDAPQIVENLHTGAASTSIVIGDMDLVGGLDVILRGENDAIILVLNTTGDALNWEPITLPIAGEPLGYSYRAPQVLDVDGDGDLDLAESKSPAIHWLRNDLNEGGALAFEENVIETWFTSGSGMFARSPCGVGAAVVFVPANPSLPVRWNSYLPLLHDMPYSNDIADLPRGTDLLFADITGDGRGDVVMSVNDGVSLFANTIEPPTEILDLPVIDTLCLSGPAVPLPDVTPAGGHWYGLQIQGDMLFRANLGTTMDLPAVHAVYASNGCPMGAERSIHVMQEPVITTLIPAVLCSADAPFTLHAAPTSVEWFGLDGGDVVDPATWSGGYIVCQYTDGTGSTCANVEGPIQRWNSLPASLAPAGPFCVNDAVQTINVAAAPPFNVNWGGPVSDATPTSAQFDPTQGAGTYEIILTAEPFGPNQCRNADTLQVVVGDLPVIAFEPMGIYCASGDPIALGGAEPTGGTWSGTAVTDGQLDPTAAGIGTHVINYHATSDLGCGAEASTSIELADATTVAWTVDDLSFCAGDEPCVFTALPTGGAWAMPLSADGVLDIATLTPGTVPIRYTYTDPRGCELTNAVLVAEMGAPAEVSITAPTHICVEHEAFELTGSAAGTWSGAVNGEGNSILVDPAALGVGTWNVTLVVIPADACSGSASVELEVSICAGVEEEVMMEPCVAPNPFRAHTTLTLGREGVAQVHVIDATGRVVLTRAVKGVPGTRTELDLGAQALGMYTVRVTYADAISSIRVLKAE